MKSGIKPTILCILGVKEKEISLANNLRIKNIDQVTNSGFKLLFVSEAHIHKGLITCFIS